VKDPNGRAYNRTKHLDERRRMMQAWGGLSGRTQARGGRDALPQVFRQLKAVFGQESGHCWAFMLNSWPENVIIRPSQTPRHVGRKPRRYCLPRWEAPAIYDPCPHLGRACRLSVFQTFLKWMLVDLQHSRLSRGWLFAIFNARQGANLRRMTGADCQAQQQKPAPKPDRRKGSRWKDWREKMVLALSAPACFSKIIIATPEFCNAIRMTDL
jgi:hypothetical protein